MTVKEIDISLPKLTEAIKEILKQHKNDKGIIHCHTFRIAKHLKTSLRSPRIIMHNSENREEMLKKHMSSKKPSVLLSPSMTEGIDLHGNNSRFQIICKVPYPYLGDKIVKKRMNKWKWWYSLQTAKTIVQATGRSVRSSNDHAVTYILDADWYNFYTRNINYFPDDFKKCIKG
jgi:Rad3-related DNA helicase